MINVELALWYSPQWHVSLWLFFFFALEISDVYMNGVRLTWRRTSSDASWAGRGCCRRWWWRTLLRDRAQSTASAQTFLESSPSRTCPTQTGPPGKCFPRVCSASDANVCSMWHSILYNFSSFLLNNLHIGKRIESYLDDDSLIGLFV